MAQKHTINLLRGWPAKSLLPADSIRAAASAALSDPGVAYDALEYGPDPGYSPCREAIADWLTSFYAPPKAINPQRICITGGASQNLGCMLSVYTDPSYTRNIWIVAPAYFLAFGIFEDAGFGDKMRAVPEDEQGVDIAYLRKEITKSEEEAQQQGKSAPLYKRNRSHRAKVYKHLIYCVPTFSNPSSRTMSLDRRRELVRLAREFDALIAPDDVYDVLQWPADTSRHSQSMDAAHLPRLVDIDRSLDGGTDRHGADGYGNACSNGTFSKIVGPGIRVGWVEGTEKFAYGISQGGSTKSGGSPCQLTSTYVTHLLTSGQIGEHIKNMLRPAYASRYKKIVRAIEEHLSPLGFTMPQPNRDVVGGYFVWLALPEGIKAGELARRCQQEESLIIAPGQLFAIPGDDSITFEHSVRLCFSFEEEGRLSEGVRRLAHVATRLVEKSGDGGEYVVVEKSGKEGTVQTLDSFA